MVKQVKRSSMPQKKPMKKDTIEEVEFLLGKLYLKAKDAAEERKEWILKNQKCDRQATSTTDR